MFSVAVELISPRILHIQSCTQSDESITSLPHQQPLSCSDNLQTITQTQMRMNQTQKYTQLEVSWRHPHPNLLSTMLHSFVIRILKASVCFVFSGRSQNLASLKLYRVSRGWKGLRLPVAYDQFNTKASVRVNEQKNTTDRFL